MLLDQHPDHDDYFNDKIEYSNGGKYHGQISEGCRHGQGTYQFENGDMYEGVWVFNVPSGYGMYNFSLGGHYSGEFLNGLPHGPGTYTSTDPLPLPTSTQGDAFVQEKYLQSAKTFQQALQRSKVDSPMRLKFPEYLQTKLPHRAQDTSSGTFLKSLKKYEGQWAYGYPDGSGLALYANGDRYQGVFQNGLRSNGEGKYIFKSLVQQSSRGENLYIGSWLKDKFHGLGQLYINGKIVYSGCWSDGLKQGKGEFHFENGYSYKGEWMDDVPHGRGELRFQQQRGSNPMTWNYGVPDSTVEMEVGQETYVGEVRFALEGDSSIGFLVRQGQGLLRRSDGTTYEGEWLLDHKEGRGQFIFSDGSTYYGDWRNDLMSGQGVMVYQNQDQYEGQFLDHQPNGYGVYRFENGDIHEGQFQRGRPHGRGNYTYAKNEQTKQSGVKYEGDWRNGLRDGFGALFYSTIYRYDGQWQEGYKQGQGTYYYPSGDKYEGWFVKNLRQGKGKMQYANGERYDGEWLQDMKHGQGVLYLPNGQVMQGKWIKDQPTF